MLKAYKDVKDLQVRAVGNTTRKATWRDVLYPWMVVFCPYQDYRKGPDAILPTVIVVPQSKNPHTIIKEEGVVDFWIKDWVEYNRGYLAKYGAMILPWSTPQGLFQTASSLWELRNEPAKQVAVLIFASIHVNKKDGLLGPAFKNTIRGLTKLALEEFGSQFFREHCTWHHAVTQAVPEKALDYFPSINVTEDWEDIVKLAAADAVFAFHVYEYVRITPVESILHPVNEAEGLS